MIALVGSPNSGKTTLFNSLTGSRQKTGNYSGVTVEKKQGTAKSKDGIVYEILDLPGAYSLSPRTPDEEVTANIVMNNQAGESRPRAIIAVADSLNLETNLYLVLELLELGLPMVLALTMDDLAKKSRVKIDFAELSKRLGIPVVPVTAVKNQGLDDLLEKLKWSIEKGALPVSPAVHQVNSEVPAIVRRYQRIEDTVKACVDRRNIGEDVTKKIDNVLLNRFLGPVILVIFFALMFQAIFTLAETPMGWIEAGIAALQEGVKSIVPDNQFRSLVVDGILAGVGSVVIFLPQIILLFAFILFFEDSGYMARAAFILDRLMKSVGLSGRAFIPLLSSFACAIPGIMATRTIDNRRDRLITIMVSPLMTCSARLPIYTMLVGAFVPNTPALLFFTWPALTMLGLYLFGIVSAIVVAWVMKKLMPSKGPSSFVMELPTYKLPALKNLVLGLVDRSKIFLTRAGTIILGVAIALWFLSSYPKTDPSLGAAYQLENSFAGKAGKLIEPVIQPLGYDWKIGIGILSSFAAREVILSTLATVYSTEFSDDNTAPLAERIAATPGFSLATVFSLLIFYALACQCMSTLAITRRETNSWRWPAAMFAYMTVLAWLAAWATYNITQHFIK